MKFKVETLMIAESTSESLKEKFYTEVKRIMESGGIDPNNHNRGMLFGVALENLADDYLRGFRKTREYKNMKRF